MVTFSVIVHFEFAQCTITENVTTKARATFCYSHVAKCRRGSEGHRSAVMNASAVFSSTTTERPHEFGYTGTSIINSLRSREYFDHTGYPGPPNGSRRRAEGLNISELSVRIEAARTFLTCQPLQLVAQRDEPHGLSGIFEKINDAPRRRFQMGGFAVRQEVETFGRTAQMLL